MSVVITVSLIRGLGTGLFRGTTSVWGGGMSTGNKGALAGSGMLRVTWMDGQEDRKHVGINCIDLYRVNDKNPWIKGFRY